MLRRHATHLLKRTQQNLTGPYHAPQRQRYTFLPHLHSHAKQTWAPWLRGSVKKLHLSQNFAWFIDSLLLALHLCAEGQPLHVRGRLRIFAKFFTKLFVF